MSRNRNSRKKKSTFVLLIAAVALLAASALGSTRAALTYYSQDYAAQLNVDHIGVSLLENGETISSRNYDEDAKSGELLKNLVGKDENFKIGRQYKEELAVKNSGEINQYVRVRVFKSWMDADGKKDTALSPDLIDLHLTGDDWIKSSDETPERVVLYYKNVLKPGETTKLFADTIRIDNYVAQQVATTSTKEGNKTTTTATYKYNGYTFNLKAEVDAVQTHNAKDAIKSAWGVDASLSGDTITAIK